MKKPSPAPLQTVPDVNAEGDAADAAAAAALEERMRTKKGRSSTILTGPNGALNTPVTTARQLYTTK